MKTFFVEISEFPEFPEILNFVIEWFISLWYDQLAFYAWKIGQKNLINPKNRFDTPLSRVLERKSCSITTEQN